VAGRAVARAARDLGILNLIGTYDVSALDDKKMDEVRDELFYLLGRHFYSKGEFDQAIALFTRVDINSEFYIKAKFFEGVTYVRKARGQAGRRGVQGRSW